MKTYESAKQELRKQVELVLEDKATWGLRVARGGATIGGIMLGAKAVEAGEKAYKKIKEIKAKKRRKKVSEASEKLAKLLKHRRAIGKILAKAAITGAAWTAGEKLISKGANAAQKAAKKAANKR